MIIIAALLAAFMAVVGSVLEGTVVDEQIERQTKAREQLSILSKALEQYAAYNGNRYPCPARPDLAYSNSGFGSAVNNNSCHTGTLNTGVLTGINGLPSDVSTSQTIRGMIPVRSLAPFGVTLEDAFDPWGTRIMYVVARPLTVGGNGVVTSGPTLSEPVTSTTLSEADFVLISYGKDRLGGIVKSQISSMTTVASCPSSSTKLREENCDSDLTFIRRPIYISSNASDTEYFDDIITAYAGASNTECVATSATWNTNCSYTLTDTMPHGSAVTVPNSAAGYVGQATVSCVNGAYVISNNFCQPTGASCAWGASYNTWASTTDCNDLPDFAWTDLPLCTDAPCSGITTTPGTTTTYATAAANCTTAMCRESATCDTSYGGVANTATTQIRVCRPLPGCSAGAKNWNTNCSGSYAGAAVGVVVNVTNSASGYTGSISGTCQGDGSISWNAGTCSASTCTLPWGGTIADGQSVTAYQASAPAGAACVSQTRTCSGGTLSGSYTFQSCNAGCNITYDGSAHDVSHGFYVIRYGSSSCISGCNSYNCGELGCCESNAMEASCWSGVVYGSNPVTYTNTSCSESYIGGCFVGDAPITMADGGYKPVSELKAGDKVRGKTGINTVVRVPARTASQTLYGFNGSTPIVTGGHPFHTKDGWKAFDPSLTPEEQHGVTTTKLEVGDVLLLDDGKELTVESVTTDTSNAPVTVYNPIVDGDHTYFADHKLVHNKCANYNCP